MEFNITYLLSQYNKSFDKYELWLNCIFHSLRSQGNFSIREMRNLYYHINAHLFSGERINCFPLGFLVYEHEIYAVIFFFLIYLFIYFWLCWVFVSV